MRLIILVTLGLSSSACGGSKPYIATPGSVWAKGQLPNGGAGAAPAGAPTRSYSIPPARAAGSPELNPTPDAPHYQPAAGRAQQSYVVQPGDILSAIAQKYSVSVQALTQANNITDENSLQAGQTLVIPVVAPQPAGPANKIIPNSELVYGPLSEQTDVAALIQSKAGYLASYSQVVNGETLNAAQAVRLAAQESSINPRLLLALVEYRSGWLT